MKAINKTTSGITAANLSRNAFNIIRAAQLAKQHGLGVTVEQGRCAVVRVTFMDNGKSHVETLKRDLTGAQAIKFLNSIKA